MTDLSDVILFVFQWCSETYLPLHLFGRSWNFSILFILLLPVSISIVVFVVRSIMDLARG